MLIKRLYLPSDMVAPVGLKEIKMTRLGHYIALAGKNGAGKTRLLNILEKCINERFEKINNVLEIMEQIKFSEEGIDCAPDRDKLQGILAQHQEQLTNIHNLVIADEHDKFKALRFVPKKFDLRDPRQDISLAITNNAWIAGNKAGIENIQLNCLYYIQKLQNDQDDICWNYDDWGGVGDLLLGAAKTLEQEKEDAICEYESLNNLIKTLLGVQLNRTNDGEATIFGKPLADSGLSEGQKIILQLAVALHAQKGILNNTVFILDELENHLHPAAAIDLLRKLDEVAPSSQIWIATHSVSLLAYIASKEPMALWYMEDGRVTHSGRRPEQVLRGLLGDEDRIGQIHAFTGLPSLLAAITYAAESLLPPKTSASAGMDPQVRQISRILEERADSHMLSILDYGAGKGRLLEGIAYDRKADDVASKINYIAFDHKPSHGDSDVCRAVITEYFKSSEGRYFNLENEFFATKDDETIDVVVMCNVLHEISPSKWLPLFSVTSLIMRALKPNGFLLLVEDQRIPVGEKAHEYGFLVLDTLHLKTLFDIKESDIAAKLFVQDDCRLDGRLKAHLIAKSLLKRITDDNKKKAIDQLLHTALEQVREIRNMDASYSNGLLHGFWTQQLANAYMYVIENSQLRR